MDLCGRLLRRGDCVFSVWPLCGFDLACHCTCGCRGHWTAAVAVWYVDECLELRLYVFADHLSEVMSITWIVLVLPATFAEVIGLSLVKPGKSGYLDVQVYTGFMFMGAFIFSKPCIPSFQIEFWRPQY